MKIIKFIRDVLKDFLYGAFARLVIALGVVLISVVLTTIILTIPTIIYFITKNSELFRYSVITEMILILIFGFIYDNGKNIIKYFQNKWSEVE